MEMIAMLGGLGATQPGFSPEGAAFATQISATKNVQELMVVVAAIDAATLRPDEKSALKVIAMEKKDSFDSIFRKPLYWVGVAAVLGAAWYHRDKIKSWLYRGSLRGLSGVSEFDSAMNNANEAFREAEKAWSRGKHRDAMEMARLADSYISDAKRESGSDSFRKSLASSLEGQVRDLRHHLDALLRPAGRSGKPVPGELQSMSYSRDSIASRRGYKSYR